jgi:hypothetical protein
MVACSALTNLDDLSGSDAMNEGDVASDVTIGDGGVDAIADAEAGPSLPFSCAQVDAAFCDDFEADGSFVPPWSSITTQATGTLTRAQQDSGCVLMTLGAGDAAPSAFLSKTISATASKIHYAFDLQVRSYATSPSASVNANHIYLPVVDGGGLIAGYVYLTLSSGSSRLVEQHHSIDAGFSAQISTPFPSPAVGTWTHFDVMVDVVADIASVAINGADAGTINLPPVYSPGSPNPTAGLGFETVSSDQFSVYIDNTVVWIE